MRQRNMPRKHGRIHLRAPVLDLDAVVEIHAFLEELMTRFESRYGAQMRRFHDDRDRRNRDQYELNLFTKIDNDLPF